MDFKASTRKILMGVAVLFGIVALSALLSGQIDVALLGAAVAGGLFYASSRIPESTNEHNLRFEKMRQDPAPQVVRTAKKKLSDLEARQRGNEAAHKIADAVRAIERDYGPYATVKWNKGQDVVYVTTENSSEARSFSLEQVTGIKLADSSAMRRIMDVVAIDLNGEHEVLGYET